MSSPILLDTCAVIWLAGDLHLARNALDAIRDAMSAGEKLRVSPITGWEIGIAASRGRFRTKSSPQRWLEELLRRPDILVVGMSPELLLESSFLPGSPPRDPADRIIAATAREYGLKVMTRDRELLDYAEQGYLSAVPC